MPAPDRAPYASPLRSPTVFAAAVRASVRRHRLGRLTLLVALTTGVGLRLDAALDEAGAARARWAPDATAWVTTVDIEAGGSLEPGAVTEIDIPAGLLPAGATTADPAGTRARIDVTAGAILLDTHLSGAGSTNAARTPPGAATIALDRTSDLFSVGDRVDVHDQIDGRRLATRALVVAVTDGDVAVAVDESAVADVVRGLGRGGVVAVLRGG